MKQALPIALLVYAAFAAEFALYNAFGSWCIPQLMLVAIVFCGLYWGIRYSIWAAFVAGVLKDSFGMEPFGTYLFVYIVAAYLTTFVRNNLYQPGSRFSRAVVTFFVLVGVFILETLMHMRLFDVDLQGAFMYIFIPQIVATMVVVTWAFHFLRDIAIRLKL